LINGVKVMYATNVSLSEEIQQDPVDVLDQFETAEFVPTGYRCTLSAQMVRVITNPIKLRDGVRLFPRVEDILSAQEMTATLMDRVTDTVLANVERVKAQRYSLAVPARGIVMSDVDFVCIRIRDESEIT